MELRELIQSDALTVVFQPLLELGSRRIFAYEALVRTFGTQFKDPPSLFRAAIQEGRVGELGRAIRKRAIDGCPDFPLFLNVHPSEFDDGWLVRPDDPLFQHEHDVFLEITESVPLSHFALCNSVLKEVRGKGINLAVDDLGAGYSNLKYIADLAPEVVKLDRELVTNLAGERRLQKLVSSIVRLCDDLGARVVAEGIETNDELSAVRDTGAQFGQGYFIARPRFPPPPLTDDILAPGTQKAEA